MALALINTLYHVLLHSLMHAQFEVMAIYNSQQHSCMHAWCQNKGIEEIVYSNNLRQFQASVTFFLTNWTN